MLALKLILAVYVVVVLGFCVFFGYAARKGCDPYPPEAAEAPKPCPCGAQDEYDHAPSCLDEHFKTAPRDEIDEAFDWHAHEYEMRKQT